MVVKKETKVLSPKLDVVFQALFGLEKTIVILITNFKISNLEELEYHSTWKIIETKAKKENHIDKQIRNRYNRVTKNNG